MPLIEIATVRLRPSFSSNIPAAFDSTWTRACEGTTKAANGVPFRLYHAVPPADKELYYLVGGWQKGEDHIAFLSTPEALTLAKSIGEYMSADIVRHIDGDIGVFDHSDKGRPKKLRVGVYKVPELEMEEWESRWKSSHPSPGGAGGWDMSAEVQHQHKAFRQMGELTNSVSAFGGKDEAGSRTWVWVESGEEDSTMASLQNVEPEVFEIEHVLG